MLKVDSLWDPKISSMYWVHPVMIMPTDEM